MPYTIEQDGVYFYDVRLQDADPESFEILSESFARDARAVYAHFKRYADGDPASFEVLWEDRLHPTQYARDNRHVYKTNLPAIIKNLSGAAVRLLDRHYASDGAAVYSFDAERLLKNVAAERFRVLGHGYAAAADAVFFRGRKVPGAKGDTFRAIGPTVGTDAKAVFWEELKVVGLDPASLAHVGGNYYRTGGRVLHSGSGLEVALEGIDTASLAVLAGDYVRDNNAVFFRNAAIPGADANTFVVLDAGYAKDAVRVYYERQIIADADAASFEVVNREASDRFRVYEGTLGTERLGQRPVEDVSPERLADVARQLTEKRMQVLWPVFDAVQSNDNSEAIRGHFAARPPQAAAPPFSIGVDGARLTDGSAGRALGSFAGYLGAIGSVWGLARKKILGTTPCVRAIDERDTRYPPGDILIRETTPHTLPELFTACELLALSGEHDEAELIAFQLSNGLRGLPQAEAQTWFLKLKQLLAIYNLPIRWLRRIDATSPQAAAKKLAVSRYPSSPHTLERVLTVERLHELIGEVAYFDFPAFNKLVPPFLPLLNDPHPLVRDLMWQNIDFLASQLFLHHAYATCLEHVPGLIDRGINLEINLARRWECLMATGNEQQAEQDWSALSTITSARDRAPRQHSGLHTDYPNYDFWQVGGFLRLASAYRSLADGKDPCAHVVIRDPQLPDESARRALLQKATAAIAIAAQRIPELARTYNAFVIGDVVAELLVDLNAFTKEWDYGDAEYVMHRQYVEHVLTKRPYQLTQVEARRTGLYQKDRGRFFDMLASSRQVTPALGQSYGLEYHATGTPLSRTVPTTITVSRRFETAAAEDTAVLATYDSVTYLGMDNAFYWTFDKEEELAPATWSFDLAIDPAGPAPFRLAHTFDVASP